MLLRVGFSTTVPDFAGWLHLTCERPLNSRDLDGWNSPIADAQRLEIVRLSKAF